MTPVEVYEKVSPSVVAIRVEVERLTPFGYQRTQAQGSGFVYDPQGYIVTNNHVVADASKVEIVFQDGTSIEARVVGADPYSDLAVVKLLTVDRSLQAVTLGDSSKLKIGEPVVAIGNPLGLSGSATSGIISQLGRLLPTDGYSITGVIQFDAAVNPGNSGGPLLNQWGEVIGITTAIASPTGVFSGIGFAVPSNTVKREVPVLIQTGKYDHPWFGISGGIVSAELAKALNLNFTGGILVVDVIPGSPAEKAGLRPSTKEIQINGATFPVGGDIIIGIDGKRISKLEDLLVYVEENKQPGDVVVLEVVRDHAKHFITLTLGTRPPPTS